MSSAPAFEPLTFAEARARQREEHDARIGRTIAHWRVDASAGQRDGGTLAYRCSCTSCGAVEVLGASELLAATVCLSCLTGAPEHMDEPSARALARLAAVPRLDPDLPCSEDVTARAWMADHDESTLEELGRAFGVSRQAIAATERTALAKMRRAMAEAGYGPDDVLVRAWRNIAHATRPSR